MKNLVLLFTLLVSPFVLVAQKDKIPNDLRKHIEVIEDEFEDNPTYIMKGGGALSIQYKNNKPILSFSLQAVNRGAYFNLKKIIIIAGTQKIKVEKNDTDFSQKEKSRRVITHRSTGRFGTSSYRPAVFGNEMFFYDDWTVDANEYIDIINAIIANKGGKAKLEGEADTFFLEFSKKDARRMDAIKKLYEYLLKN